MTSTRNLSEFPGILELHRIMQSLAMLDAVVEEDWEFRYFSFDSQRSRSEQMGSMRNGSGDDLFAVFSDGGCFLRGFDHESAMSPWKDENSNVWPAVLSSVPEKFASQLNEPAFHMSDTTFCIWRQSFDREWSCGDINFPTGDDPDGSEWMLALFNSNPISYKEYADDYFELELPEHVIARVLSHEPLSPDLLASFPSARQYDDLCKEARTIAKKREQLAIQLLSRTGASTKQVDRHAQRAGGAARRGSRPINPRSP